MVLNRRVPDPEENDVGIFLRDAWCAGCLGYERELLGDPSLSLSGIARQRWRPRLARQVFRGLLLRGVFPAWSWPFAAILCLVALLPRRHPGLDNLLVAIAVLDVTVSRAPCACTAIPSSPRKRRQTASLGPSYFLPANHGESLTPRLVLGVSGEGPPGASGRLGRLSAAVLQYHASA